MRKQNKTDKLERGGRNLVILGVLSVLIAMMTTGMALAIYHNSGDIYLDRSRPGFLPDEEELEGDDKEEEEKEYSFEKDGGLTKEDIELFIENLNKEIKAINDYRNPFSEEVLSDEHLGIPAEEKPADAPTEQAEQVQQ